MSTHPKRWIFVFCLIVFNQTLANPNQTYELESTTQNVSASESWLTDEPAKQVITEPEFLIKSTDDHVISNIILDHREDITFSLGSELFQSTDRKITMYTEPVINEGLSQNTSDSVQKNDSIEDEAETPSKANAAILFALLILGTAGFWFFKRILFR